MKTKDKNNLEFHIENNDYFGTLATVLNLQKQFLDKKDNSEILQILEIKINELNYLQKNYKIVKKEV